MKKKASNKRNLLAGLKRPSPSVVVTGVALLVIGIGIVAQGISSRSSWAARLYPRVVYLDEARQTRMPKNAGEEVQLQNRPIFSGEVFQTADRLGEISALAGGLIVYSVTKGAELAPGNGGDISRGLPTDHRALLAGMSAKGILPQGIKLENDLTLSSPTSNISVRYMREPLSVEIISLAKSKDAGPALLIRMPDENSEKDAQGIRFYQAQKLDSPAQPDPFAPASKIIQLGWMPQNLSLGTPVATEQYETARRWLAAQSAEMNRGK